MIIISIFKKKIIITGNQLKRVCPVTSRTIKNINEGVSLETVKELMSIKLLENIWITVKERDADF